MSKRNISHLELGERYTDAMNLAALAGLLADELVDRFVHPNDADKPDVAAVAILLAERIKAHMCSLNEMMDHGTYLRERAAADSRLGELKSA